MFRDLRVGAVIPAFNEEASVGLVVDELRRLERETGGAVIDEIVVCDNGSTDRTGAVALAAGARVVVEPRRGYGSACLAGIAEHSEVDVFLFVDADRSDRIADALPMLEEIARGADLVIGSRALGGAEEGALTPQQKFGNCLASFLIRRLWNHPTSDLGPFRAIRRNALERIGMRDLTYGWTVEMQVKAIQAGLQVREVPAAYRRRIGKSKISGTVRGTIGAGYKILGTIGMLWLSERRGRALCFAAASALALLLIVGVALAARTGESAPEPPGTFLRGLAVGMHAGEDGYDYRPAIREVSDLGCGAVELVIPYFQLDVRSSLPRPLEARTPPDHRIAEAIRGGRAAGLDVYLLPIVLLEQAGEKDWRGVLDPEDPDEWWRRYEALLLDLAAIAQREGATGLSIGSELAWSEGLSDRWLDLIAKVRRVYRGKLLYSANWDHYEAVTFWENLDAIGISGYFELTKEFDASPEELEDAWRRVRRRLVRYADRIGRPLIFTEVGYPVVDGGAVYPWDYTREGPSDEAEQAAALAAFIGTWEGDPRVSAAFIYEWNLPGRPLGHYSPRGRLAEEVLRKWFQASNGNELSMSE